MKGYVYIYDSVNDQSESQNSGVSKTEQVNAGGDTVTVTSGREKRKRNNPHQVILKFRAVMSFYLATMTRIAMITCILKKRILKKKIIVVKIYLTTLKMKVHLKRKENE